MLLLKSEQCQNTFFPFLLQYEAGVTEIRRRENRCILSFPNMKKELAGHYECKITQGDAVTECDLTCDGKIITWF